MNTFRLRHMIVGFLCLSIALLLSWLMRGAAGWMPDIVLATLVAFAFYGKLSDIFVLSGFAAWISNWTDMFQAETILLVVLPFAVFGLRKTILPFKNPFSVLLLTVGCVMAFYAIAVGRGVLSDPWMLARTAMLSGLWGAFVYAFFSRMEIQ